jgi:uncharacterized protein (TIGR02588 family)
MSDRSRSGEKDQGGARRDERTSHGTSPWEWAVAALSALLVLGAIVHLGYEIFTEPATPPQIVIRIDSVMPSGEGYVVEFSAVNHGQTTAAALGVRGELRDSAAEPETSETTIDYVPAEGERRAGLYFTRDPRTARLKIRPLGYDLP